MPSPIRTSLVWWAAAVSLGCSSSSGTTTEPDAQTLMAVDPADFPAMAASNGDSFGAYVATLIDVSAEDAGVIHFAVQSSPPTARDRSVAFGRVVPNRAYEAEVDLYTDRDGDLGTIDVCTFEGTRTAVTREDEACTTTLATPFAKLHCYGWQPASNGEGRPGMAIEYRTMTLHYCVQASE